MDANVPAPEGPSNGNHPTAPQDVQTRAEWVAQLCGQLWERWQRGERAAVEEYLGEPRLAEDEEATLDLIYTEYVIRAELGDRPSVSEYLERFPRFREQLSRQLTLDQILLSPEASRDAARTETLVEAPRPEPVPVVSAQSIGKYTSVRWLAEGGQGAVYRATHPTLGKEVILKLSHKQLAPNSEHKDALLQEGRLLAELDHPNLARVYDLDFHHQRPFLVMEYIPGRNLQQYAEQHKLTPGQAAALVAQLARAVALAHRHGVIHRDLKPKNILIDQQGRPRVIDFGLARLENAWAVHQDVPGIIAGTVQYMAPEQARGETERIGERSDIFALGGILYFLLTGQPPFPGHDVQAVLRLARACRLDADALTKAAVPARLRHICLKALAAQPEDRFASAEDMANQLERFHRKSYRLPGLIAAAVVLLAIGGLLAFLHLSRPPGPGPLSNGGQAAGPSDIGKDQTKTAIVVGAEPLLQVKIFDRSREKYRDLLAMLPVPTGATFRLAVETPPHVHTALFLAESDGPLTLLERAPAEKTPMPLRYPPDPADSLQLAPPVRTVFILVCCDAAGPVNVDEVQRLWREEPPWPLLPADTLVQLRNGKAEAGGSRNVIPSPQKQANPVEEVQQRLERLGQRLREHLDHVEGTAFTPTGKK